MYTIIFIIIIPIVMIGILCLIYLGIKKLYRAEHVVPINKKYGISKNSQIPIKLK